MWAWSAGRTRATQRRSSSSTGMRMRKTRPGLRRSSSCRLRSRRASLEQRRLLGHQARDLRVVERALELLEGVVLRQHQASAVDERPVGSVAREQVPARTRAARRPRARRSRAAGCRARGGCGCAADRACGGRSRYRRPARSARSTARSAAALRASGRRRRRRPRCRVGGPRPTRRDTAPRQRVRATGRRASNAFRAD